MLVHLRGILKDVHEVEQLEKTDRQKIQFHCPNYDKLTGEKKGEDIFPAVILGDNITKINAESMKGEIVTARCFLNSFEKIKDDATFYNLSLSVVEMKLQKDE